MAGGDDVWAARLIERHLDELILRRNEAATLARWLTALPVEMRRRRPRLNLAEAIVTLQRGRLDEVEPLLASAEQALVAADDEPYEPSIARIASILANMPAMLRVARADLARQHGDAVHEAVFAQQAQAQLTDEDWLLGSPVRYHLAVADWMDGRLGPAEAALDEIVTERTASGEPPCPCAPATTWAIFSRPEAS